jgi:hypothetical protein
LPQLAADLILDAILLPIPESNVGGTPLSPMGSEASSPTLVNKNPVTQNGLEMIVNALRNVDNPVVYPIEIRTNICTFLVQLSRNTSGPKLLQVQEATKPILEKIKELSTEKEDLLTNAATKVLEGWKSR